MLPHGALGSEERSQVPRRLAANLDAQRTIITCSLCARGSAESERGLPSLPTSLPRHRLRRWVGGRAVSYAEAGFAVGHTPANARFCSPADSVGRDGACAR
jgi:hypothetical protein